MADLMLPLTFNGSFVWRVDKDYAEAFAIAVGEFGKADLYIHAGELHCNELNADLSAFWDLLEIVQGDIEFERRLQVA